MSMGTKRMEEAAPTGRGVSPEETEALYASLSAEQRDELLQCLLFATARGETMVNGVCDGASGTCVGKLRGTVMPESKRRDGAEDTPRPPGSHRRTDR